MPTPVIRPLARPQEIAICARIMADSDPWKTLGRAYEACYKTIADPSKEVYSAYCDGDVLGFLILNMRGAFVGYIQTVAVAEAWRGQGLGSQLIACAEQRIFRDSANVFLCVSSFNPGAQRLYHRLGYTIVGELPDYLVRGQAEILLRKTTGPLTEFRCPADLAPQDGPDYNPQTDENR